jgi:divalent metal cation (Fe/Co/Zn/Cd) transporter
MLRAEGRVTFIDGILAAAVLAGLVLNAAVGWWWADPLAAMCWSSTAACEIRAISTGHH